MTRNSIKTGARERRTLLEMPYLFSFRPTLMVKRITEAFDSLAEFFSNDGVTELAIVWLT